MSWTAIPDWSGIITLPGKIYSDIVNGQVLTSLLLWNLGKEPNFFLIVSLESSKYLNNK
jgi:hypothetical protein